MAAWRVAESLLTLRDQVNAFAPNRSKISDGFIGDASHAAVPSDHNPNQYGVVCAYDITHDPKNGLDAHALADRLLQRRHPNLKYIISNGRIAGDWANYKWTKYRGIDPHDTHIHISVGTGEDGKSNPPYDDKNLWNVEDMSKDAITKEEYIELHKAFTGQEPTPDFKEAPYYNNVARPLSPVINDLKNSAGAKEWRRRAEAFGWLLEEIAKRDKGIDMLRGVITSSESNKAQMNRDAVVAYIDKNLK